MADARHPFTVARRLCKCAGPQCRSGTKGGEYEIEVRDFAMPAFCGQISYCFRNRGPGHRGVREQCRPAHRRGFGAGAAHDRGPGGQHARARLPRAGHPAASPRSQHGRGPGGHGAERAGDRRRYLVGHWPERVGPGQRPGPANAQVPGRQRRARHAGHHRRVCIPERPEGQLPGLVRAACGPGRGGAPAAPAAVASSRATADDRRATATSAAVSGTGQLPPADQRREVL